MELFYRTYGKGKPFIILHGILGISDNWVTFGMRMSENGFQIFIPDQRNHGHSPHNPAFNYYSLTDDLVEFIDHHKIEEPVILGHSMGGKVAMRYALENSDKVEKLIIVDTSLRTYVRFRYHQDLIDAMLSVDFSNTRSREEVKMQLGEKITDKRAIQFLLKNLYWKEKHKLGWRPNLQAISYNLEDMYDGVFFSVKFDKPALFVRGGISEYVLDTDFPSIYANFPNAIIETIPNGTHWVHSDEPEMFFQLVQDFVKE